MEASLFAFRERTSFPCVEKIFLLGPKLREGLARAARIRGAIRPRVRICAPFGRCLVRTNEGATVIGYGGCPCTA